MVIITGPHLTDADREAGRLRAKHERLQIKRECYALRKKGVPQIRNEFESQIDFAIFYSNKTNSCLVARSTRWKNGAEYAEINTIPAENAGIWYEYYPVAKSKPEIEKILSEQIDTLK